jgi:glycosyltransferase involved in cell wall biosynthesis
MKDNPLVSIITPSYNQGGFIEETILSVKNQDYPNIEHIVVDGGSTDNTLEILKKYEKEYNLRWIFEPDEGQSDAVNKGFGMAKGKIIGWLNSDDVYFDKQAISYVVEEFEKNPEVDVIYGDSVIIDANNFIKRVFKAPGWSYNRLLIGSSYIPQPATFFRKKVIIENKIDKNLGYSMDIEFWLRLGVKYEFLHVGRILAGDRLHKEAKRLSGNTKTYRSESKKIRKNHGQNFNLKYYLLHYFIILYISALTRLPGLEDILKIESTKELAFDAKLKSRLSRIGSQLSPLSEIYYIYSIIKTKFR